MRRWCTITHDVGDGGTCARQMARHLARRIDGERDEDCGKWYCGYDVEDYRGMVLCGDCADSRRAEDEEEENDGNE